ncbi:hypothetical protein GCM10010413_37440 [Promicromonospora sukumoe]
MAKVPSASRATGMIQRSAGRGVTAGSRCGDADEAVGAGAGVGVGVDVGVTAALVVMNSMVFRMLSLVQTVVMLV